MPPADILILVEHPARELDVACALSVLLRDEFNLRAEIASLVFRPEEALRRLRPSVVVTPFFYSEEDSGICSVLPMAEGVKFVNLAYEQFVTAGNRRFKRPRDETARCYVTHLAADGSFRDFSVANGVLPKNVRTVGSVTCELYRQPYRAFYERIARDVAARHGLDASKPLVFFPENYGAAFFTPAEIEARVRKGFRRDELEAYCEFARMSFVETMRWCADIASAEDIELVIRPRPSTSERFFTRQFVQATRRRPGGRLHIIGAGSVREWIVASNVTVSSYSSALVEAAIAGKPAYMVTPFPLPESVVAPWNKHAAQLSTKQQFRDAASTSDARDAMDLANWADKTLLAHGDAILNVADAIAAVCKEETGAPAIPPEVCRNAAYNRRRSMIPAELREVYRVTREWITGNDRKGLVNHCHTKDALEDDAVHARIACWSDVLGRRSRAA